MPQDPPWPLPSPAINHSCITPAARPISHCPKTDSKASSPGLCDPRRCQQRHALFREGNASLVFVYLDCDTPSKHKKKLVRAAIKPNEDDLALINGLAYYEHKRRLAAASGWLWHANCEHQSSRSSTDLQTTTVGRSHGRAWGRPTPLVRTDKDGDQFLSRAFGGVELQPLGRFTWGDEGHTRGDPITVEEAKRLLEQYGRREDLR
ncbi:hypothetical protein MAPG_09183 [Magnaporthiopsis poae ATCC 64411]|uniref:Uncharacterized protein n=1 Tax=Magnaporthiopsis poae (strain ATCC 64411 / 73-15) TaxID=644358 RepID=A0A0C4E9A4_MAGP6|nr:hypothetical protein MAPG_09183 [Magnaporthiopsis poae ATCC 64411]